MEDNCTLLLQPRKETSGPTVSDLKAKLESPVNEDKVEAMKQIITGMLNGEEMRGVLMHVIRFACTSNHHQLKKLLMIYWECVPKRSEDGKLLPEMILVCNSLRNDLTHANEYIRGCTLRLCTKLREMEVLEPLVPSIMINLEHRHAYVRRNAVLAVFSIYKSFPKLIPSAAEMIETLIQNEPDLGAKRNAFLMLFQCDQDRAVQYMHRVLDQVASMGDGFQLVVLDLVRKLCRTHPQEKARYIKCIILLMETASDTVLFECANTLVAVSNAPTAIRAAANCYTQLLRSQSDNNVKLVVLERLADLKGNHPAILQEIVMDIMRGLQSTHTDIQRRTLDLTLDVVTRSSVDKVVVALKKEIARTAGISAASTDKPQENKQMIVHAIHACAVRFPEVAPNVVGVLLDLVADDATSIGLDIASFAREMVQLYPSLRASLVEKLISNLSDIKDANVLREVLWLVGQFSETLSEVQEAFSAVNQALGTLPLIPHNDENAPTDQSPSTSQPRAKQGPTVLADGTYQTQTAVDTAVDPAAQHHLRKAILGGDYLLASTFAVCITKLLLRANKLNMGERELNGMSSRVMLILISILRAGSHPTNSNHPIDDGSKQRISMCLRAVSNRATWEDQSQLFFGTCRDALSKFLNTRSTKAKAEEDKPKVEDAKSQPDDVITFRQLKGSTSIMSQLDIEDEEATMVIRAVGSNDAGKDFSQRLNRMVQLTGFSDPIYVEAFVSVHHFDIVLELLLVNKTSETMQNLLIELSTVGDLKLCERPQCPALAPGASRTVKANIKVSSTETGVIFGSIVFDTSTSSGDKNCVLLNDIHIDIMDYLHPATCSEVDFRSMWAEFEWENKVFVNTKLTDLNELLQHVAKSTNMTCLTPTGTLPADCKILCANLYAKSVFDESALLNLSVEKLADGKIAGFVRIRSKTQGIALGLGDKITLGQQLKQS